MTDDQQSGSSTPTVEKGDVALEERRMDMKSAEGHAGSVPRGNPEREEDSVGRHWDEYERVLGH